MIQTAAIITLACKRCHHLADSPARPPRIDMQISSNLCFGRVARIGDILGPVKRQASLILR